MKKLSLLLLLAASFAPPILAGPFGAFSELAIANQKDATLPGWGKMIVGGEECYYKESLSLGESNVLTISSLQRGG